MRKNWLSAALGMAGLLLLPSLGLAGKGGGSGGHSGGAGR